MSRPASLCRNIFGTPRRGLRRADDGRAPVGSRGCAKANSPATNRPRRYPVGRTIGRRHHGRVAAAAHRTIRSAGECSHLHRSIPVVRLRRGRSCSFGEARASQPRRRRMDPARRRLAERHVRERRARRGPHRDSTGRRADIRVQPLHRRASGSEAQNVFHSGTRLTQLRR